MQPDVAAAQQQHSSGSGDIRIKTVCLGGRQEQAGSE
jgi:hypothetical protein